MKHSRILRRRYGHASSMTKRFTVTRVRLDHGGYDSGGRYYGSGAPLFSVLDNETDREDMVRAADAKAARKKVVEGIFGAPGKNTYVDKARALSKAINEEMNSESEIGYKNKHLVQKYRERLNALTSTLRPLTSGDRAWEYYDKDMDQAADNEAGGHVGYALGKLRSAAQMIAGAADRLKS